MAVLRQTNWLGQWRVDVSHLRAIESAINGDFDLLAGKIMSGQVAQIIKGFTIPMTTAVGGAASALKINVAGSLIIHFNASESGSIFGVSAAQAPEVLSGSNTNVVGAFQPSSTNYVGLDLIRSADSTTNDDVQFLSATVQTEVTQNVPLARTLNYRFVISPNTFSSSSNIAPIAKIVTDASNNVVSVTDARNLFFRLGTGSDAPNTGNSFSWGSRAENPITSTTTADPFSGGDKQLASLKDWTNATMTRLWELGGGEYWYSATNAANMKLVRAGAPFSTTNDNFEFVGGNLHWKGLRVAFENSTAFTNTINDQTINSAGLTDIAVGQCIYADVVRGSNATINAVKANLTALGTPAVPGSRFILAWRTVDGVFSRDFGFAIGSSIVPAATPLALGTVILLSGAPAVAAPVVPVVDNNSYVIGAGLSRVSTGGASLAAGGLVFSDNRAIADAGTDFVFTSTTTRTAGNLLDLQNNGASVIRVAVAGQVVLGGPSITIQASGANAQLFGGAAAASTGTDWFVNSSSQRTAGLLFDVQNNASSAFSVGWSGICYLSTAADIRANATATTLILHGNQAAAGTGTDVVISSLATRTAGNLLDVQNNATTRLRVDPNGSTFVGFGATQVATNSGPGTSGAWPVGSVTNNNTIYAWASINVQNGAPTVLASHNISQVAADGTGGFTITFLAAMNTFGGGGPNGGAVSTPSSAMPNTGAYLVNTLTTTTVNVSAFITAGTKLSLTTWTGTFYVLVVA